MSTPTGENNHDHAACVKLLTETVARLTEINIAQMQGILDIAIAAADAANSIAPSNANADSFVEKITALVEDLKSKADEAGGEMGGGGAPAVDPNPAAKTDGFCETIENDIHIAVLQTLGTQQQLFVIGESVLSEGASLVLNAGGQNAGSN